MLSIYRINIILLEICFPIFGRGGFKVDLIPEDTIYYRLGANVDTHFRFKSKCIHLLCEMFLHRASQIFLFSGPLPLPECPT